MALQLVVQSGRKAEIQSPASPIRRLDLLGDDEVTLIGPEIRVGAKSQGPNSESLNQFTVAVVDPNSVELAISGIGRE